MGNKCPKCSTDIDQDFGVVNCPGCSTVLVVDVEGNLSIADQAIHETAVTQSQINEQPVAEQPVEQPVESIPEPVQEFEATPEVAPEIAAEPALEEPIAAEPVAEEPVVEEPVQEFAQEQEIPAAPAEEMVDLDAMLGDPEPAKTPQQAIEEISEFANSDVSGGPLSYTVIIDGIDLGEVRNQVEVALSHPKFGWNLQEIMANLNQGRLVIKGLTPAKASALVLSLRSIKVKTKWGQHVFQN